MKFFLIGAGVGFVLGAAATVFYLSLATLFAANAKFTAKENGRPEPAIPDHENGINDGDEKVTAVETACGAGA
jgi:hypothetical protein